MYSRKLPPIFRAVVIDLGKLDQRIALCGEIAKGDSLLIGG